MFVGCVVAGSVMLCCQGAKVRGALVRDVAAYAIAVVAVAIILWSGKVSGILCCCERVPYNHVTLNLSKSTESELVSIAIMAHTEAVNTAQHGGTAAKAPQCCPKDCYPDSLAVKL